MTISRRKKLDEYLWGGESLVSPNCRFMLLMQENGNLVFDAILGVYQDPYAKGGGRLGEMKWYNGWSTDTKISNTSSYAVAKLMFEQKKLKVVEYHYKNVPSIPFIELWSIEVDAHEVILSVTNDGCLVLHKFDIGMAQEVVMSIGDSLWSICPKFNVDSALSTSQPTVEVTSFTMTDVGIENIREKKRISWWTWLLITMSSFVFLVSLGVGIHRLLVRINHVEFAPVTPNNANVTQPTLDEYEFKEDAEGDLETEMSQIQNWIKESNATNKLQTFSYNEGNKSVAMPTIRDDFNQIYS